MSSTDFGLKFRQAKKRAEEEAAQAERVLEGAKDWAKGTRRIACAFAQVESIMGLSREGPIEIPSYVLAGLPTARERREAMMRQRELAAEQAAVPVGTKGLGPAFTGKIIP